MGQNYYTMTIHVCGLDLNNKDNYESQNKIISNLFPNVDLKNSGLDYSVRYSEKVKWKAFIYSDKNTKNFKLINETIQKQIQLYSEKDKNKGIEKKKNEIKNHVLFLFVCDDECDIKLCDEFTNEETIELLNENFPLMLFLFKDFERDKSYYKHNYPDFDFSYLRCVNLNLIPSLKDNKDKSKTEDLISLHLNNLLYNIFDSYFTERGYQMSNQIDPLTKMATFDSGIYLPIILIGAPGAGKSTFINILNGERISKSSASLDSVTTKASFYDIKLPGKDNTIQSNTDELKEEAYIRIIDTPGFNLEKEIDVAFNEIKNIYNSYKKGKERIPVVLFFFNSCGRLPRETDKKEKIINILKYLMEYKAKIIFVITHITKGNKWGQKGAFIQMLKDNKIQGLIEEKQENIFYCDLVGNSAYGIKEIFQKIYRYLNLMEEVKDGTLCQSKEIYTQSLLEEVKKRPTFDEKLAFLKTKTTLFNDYQSKEDLITFGKKHSYILISAMTILSGGAGLIPWPFADVSIVLEILGSTIIKIGKYYGYVWKKISRKDLIAIYKGELYKKDNNIEDEKNTNIMEYMKLVTEIFAKGLMMFLALNVDDFCKSVYGIGTAIGMALGAAADAGIIYYYSRNAVNYFESKCKEDDGTIFFCARCSEYEVIFKRFKQFDNYEIEYPPQ